MLYNTVTVLYKTMTVTTNEFGQQNMWATEPRMYIDPKDALETHWERAERANGRWAMMGMVAGLISYTASGSFFFFGLLGF